MTNVKRATVDNKATIDDKATERNNGFYRIEDFRKGNIVWAKCSKWLPAWPAIVIEPKLEAHRGVYNAYALNAVCVMLYGYTNNKEREYGWVTNGMIYPFLEYLESFLGQTETQIQLNGRTPEDFRLAVHEAYKAKNGYLTSRSEDKEEGVTTPKIVKLPVVSISDQTPESSRSGQKLKQLCGICKRILHYSDGADYMFCEGNSCVHTQCAIAFSTNVSEDVKKAEYYCPTCKGESIAGFEPGPIQLSYETRLPDLNEEFVYDGENYYLVEPNNELGFGSQPSCVDAPSASTYNHVSQSSRPPLMFPLLREDSQNTINIDRFSNYIPKVFHNYVSHIEDVAPDGNCGFRAVARGLGHQQDTWQNIRDELLNEIVTNVDMWKSVLNGVGYAFYDWLRKTLDWRGSPAPVEHWMLTPETGFVIAERFRVIVHILSTRGSLTFFPITVDPDSLPHHNIVSICHTPGHFIVVEMEGEYPFPPLPSLWKQHRTTSAAKWEEMYAPRLVQFDKIVNPEKYSGQPNLPVELDPPGE